MQMARAGVAIAALDGDSVVAIGGENAEGPLRSLEIWGVDRDRWREFGVMRAPRTRHAATVLADEQILITGGGPAIAELWDGSNIVAAGKMIAARSRHTATLLGDGSVLAIGGRDARDVPIADAERWDPKTRTWRRAGRLAAPRCCHTATALPDGRVLVVGGLVECAADVKADFKVKGPCLVSTASVEIWDPATSRFTAGPGLPEPNDNPQDRAAHTATLLRDGRVLIAGGAPNHVALLLGSDPSYSYDPDRSYDDYNAYGLHDFVFDPRTNQWQTIEHGAHRVYHSATLLSDGSVLVVGGVHDMCGCCKIPQGAPPFASMALRLDLAVGEWRPAGTSLVPRARHGAALLKDGSVLVVGGVSEEWGHRTEPFGTTERWRP
jgi:hypothetical protein